MSIWRLPTEDYAGAANDRASPPVTAAKFPARLTLDGSVLSTFVSRAYHGACTSRNRRKSKFELGLRPTYGIAIWRQRSQ